MSRARFAAALAAIILLAFLGAESARFSLWTTSDEPAHLAAAREWRTGPGMVSNFEHPVLMKVLGGAYLLAACASNVNIGVRHALPVVPFAIAAAAGTLRTLVPRRRTLAIALAAVVLAATCEAALRLGREISFGNLLCGGPAGVPAILSDSNVDWGQEEGKILERVRRGDLGRVGLASLMVDESGARAVGIAGQVTAPDASVDTVFFSRFLWDLARAIEKNSEPWPKFVWLRGWLPPLRHGLEARALSTEPFGDTQLLMRLRPAVPATGSRSAPLAPTP